MNFSPAGYNIKNLIARNAFKNPKSEDPRNDIEEPENRTKAPEIASPVCRPVAVVSRNKQQANHYEMNELECAEAVSITYVHDRASLD